MQPTCFFRQIQLTFLFILNFLLPLYSDSYFNTVPIETFSNHQVPCISVYIENKKFLCIFDSGSVGQLHIIPELVEKISEKTFFNYYTLIGIRGNRYTSPVYKIPKAQIGNVEFQSVHVHEENKLFLADALINNQGQLFDVKCGRIGWEFYKPNNLLIDVPHLKIGMCDSIETLQQQKYLTQTYIETPLLSNSSLLCIQISIKNRTLNCVLDTGATHNMINLDGLDEQAVILRSAKIGNIQLEPLFLYAFPIRLPNSIDVILGMDFFRKHTVFIDFKKQSVYISKLQINPICNNLF